MGKLPARESEERKNDGIRRLSFSQYTIWATCPKQWKLTYYDKLKPKDRSIHLIFGTAIHDAIQQWLDLLFNGAKIKSKVFDMEGVFKDRLFEQFKEQVTVNADGTKTFLCNRATLEEFYLDGCEILAHVRKYQTDFFPTQGYELIGCEIPLEVGINARVRFLGYVDIVVRSKINGRIYIYDLKTSGKGWFYEKKDPKKINQLLLYKRFYAQQFNVDEDDISVKFIILKRKIDEKSEWENAKRRISGFEPSHGHPSVKKATQSFMDFVNTTFGPDGDVLVDNLKATPSDKNCRFCYFNNKPELCKESFYK